MLNLMGVLNATAANVSCTCNCKRLTSQQSMEISKFEPLFSTFSVVLQQLLLRCESQRKEAAAAVTADVFFCSFLIDMLVFYHSDISHLKTVALSCQTLLFRVFFLTSCLKGLIFPTADFELETSIAKTSS